MTDPFRSVAPRNASVASRRRQDHETDRQLLRRIQEKGDMAAFGELFIRYADRIVGAIAKRKGCYDDRVRDAVVDAFLDLYQNPCRKVFVIDLVNDRLQFTRLCGRIWRKALRYLKDDRRCETLDNQLYKAQGRRYSYEYLLALRQALHKVSAEMPDHFRILELTLWDGHDAATAAAILAKEQVDAGKSSRLYPVGSVGRLKNEIIARLREELRVNLSVGSHFTDWL
jgi:hypothetical protein